MVFQILLLDVIVWLAIFHLIVLELFLFEAKGESVEICLAKTNLLFGVFKNVKCVFKLLHLLLSFLPFLPVLPLL